MLDVGCGTGILSLLCSEAGAKHVYAIEASKGIALLCKEIIKSNNLDDKITCINETIENVKLPVETVDIIVSEWMGVYLLHESMLNSIIYARDKYLRKDGNGFMYPSIAYLYICPIEINRYLDQQLNFWNNFYNFNFKPMKRVYSQLLNEKPIVEELENTELIADEKILASFDLSTVTANDLKLLQAYNLKFRINRDASLHGFALWFDVIFHTDDHIVTLSTSPRARQTHWKQTVIFLPKILNNFDENCDSTNSVNMNENDIFECFAALKQSSSNMRNYVIDVGITKINKMELNDKNNNYESMDHEESCQGGYEDNENNGDDDDENEEDDDDDEHDIPCYCENLRCILIRKTLENYSKNEEENKIEND